MKKILLVLLFLTSDVFAHGSSHASKQMHEYVDLNNNSYMLCKELLISTEKEHNVKYKVTLFDIFFEQTESIPKFVTMKTNVLVSKERYNLLRSEFILTDKKCYSNSRYQFDFVL